MKFAGLTSGNRRFTEQDDLIARAGAGAEGDEARGRRCPEDLSHGRTLHRRGFPKDVLRIR